MTTARMFLQVAKDEAQTLYDYQVMLDDIEDLEQGTKEIMDEIMGDEFNHCLIALLSAAKVMNVKIATDDISEDPNDIEVQ